MKNKKTNRKIREKNYPFKKKIRKIKMRAL